MVLIFSLLSRTEQAFFAAKQVGARFGQSLVGLGLRRVGGDLRCSAVDRAGNDDLHLRRSWAPYNVIDFRWLQ
jgi:hypothetical protein